jgi:hypothetical protein
VAIKAMGITPTPNINTPIITAQIPHVPKVIINPDSHNCKPKRYDEYVIVSPENLLAFLKKEAGRKMITSKRKSNKAISETQGYIFPKIKSDM